MLIVAAAIWLFIGGIVGYLRAKEAYVKEMSSFPHFAENRPSKAKYDAFEEAAIVWLKWAIWGLLAVLAYLAIIAVEIYAREQSRK